MNGKLVLADGSEFLGESFGYSGSVAGEVVFTTGMVGYPESMTDPSYFGQILIFTYPLIGNYGVPSKEFLESDSIKTAGIIVSTCTETPSHHQSRMTLASWLKDEKIPGLIIKDTRALTQKLREKGAMLGKIVIDGDVEWYDPNAENVVAKVSVQKPSIKYQVSSIKYKKHIVLIDCGVKQNIIRSLVKRGAEVTVVPWDFDVTMMRKPFDGVVVSNGPGDPKMLKETIANVAQLLDKNIPTLGICLGNQLLALAAGGDTAKMKFGHRSQNQPCQRLDMPEKYYLTTQNHGFTVTKIPSGFVEWFRNANDGTNEGIMHKSKPFMSVQFHPEAFPGPNDTDWVFDEFLRSIHQFIKSANQQQ